MCGSIIVLTLYEIVNMCIKHNCIQYKCIFCIFQSESYCLLGRKLCKPGFLLEAWWWLAEEPSLLAGRS